MTTHVETVASSIDEIAAQIDAAQRTGEPIEQFGEALSLDAAYQVQARLLRLRQQRGEQLTGAKLGFTSEAKMAQMGVDEIIVGFLTDEMHLRSGESLQLTGFVHPRVEPEVAFRLSRDVAPGTTARELVASVDAIAPALEVIDSRYRDFRFSLSDVVADNTSAACYVLGDWKRFRRDIDGLAVSLFADGRIVETGSTSDILGHPVRALERLAGMLTTARYSLPAGSVVLAGAATAAVAASTASRITALIAELGQVELCIQGNEAEGAAE
ncbi:2-keto-4-pentenoate hydratase [Ruicaihuangia caeni]|uniref:Fumarylacetoacetate hydrolase family protein n=1 Tax=Ruicaihuangia caeni TaxID=3042517 RepID=A0AAW6TB21_9MICO|nr:fumarylacetoacetate hydrolase family protein [Klugiella sp. YN-L-19]MDI2099033.1 fumarylacetoacetate hydrolase family protein [Klugiella sp. YN-L-19]